MGSSFSPKKTKKKQSTLSRKTSHSHGELKKKEEKTGIFYFPDQMITLLLKLQPVNSNACKNGLPEFLRKVNV